MGLDYAHTKGVIHRDIKPSNILLTPTGDPKIVDFGIAVIAGASSRITQTGIVVGTPHYLSPEQISAGMITAAADQFALAVVAFELLTGKTPFSGKTMTEVMAAVIMASPIDALSLNPTLGAACTEVLHRALSKNPVDRFSTCLEFVETLLGALNRSPGWRPFVGELAPSSLGTTVSGKGTKVPPAGGPDGVKPVREHTRIDLPVTVGLSVMGTEPAPTGYSFTQFAAAPGPFFQSGEAHFQEIKNKLGFYQDQLQQEYEALLKQMRTTYVLWLVAVSMTFLVLLASVVLFLLHQTTGGAISTISSAMLYFLQRVFHQREDAYRNAAEAKRHTVEYGNQWALVIQTIQGMEDPKERVLREGRLVEALTAHLHGTRRTAAPQRRPRKTV